MKESSDKKIKEIEELKTEEIGTGIGKLLDFIGDRDLSVRLAAIEALSFFKASSDAKRVLIELTKDIDAEVRCYAIESLRNFPGSDVSNAIIPRLKDSDELVRIAAAEVLGDLNSQQMIPYLQQALSDKGELVRSYVAEAIGKIGDKELISILEEGLKKETRNRARLGFYAGLYRLDEKRYFDFILNMLKAKSYKVRCGAANVLAELTDKNTASRVVESLEKALAREKTIAARSSIMGSLSKLRKRFRLNSQ